MVRTVLGKRRIEPELLDSASDADATKNLQDLRRIHRYLGGGRLFASLLAEWFGQKERFTILDVGAGGCVLRDCVQNVFPNATVISLDSSFRHLASGSGIRLAADAFRLPFSPRSLDVVCSNFLLHHYPDQAIVRLLESMYEVSRCGVIAMDLQRHWLAHRFLPATAWLFRWHSVSLHDGPVSVQAAFCRQELEDLSRTAGLEDAKITVHIPWFRLSLTCRREPLHEVASTIASDRQAALAQSAAEVPGSCLNLTEPPPRP
jgi:SAM-dependent methyltransferase